MTIAKVIVDVPASVVNQTFDYAIPEQFHDVIQPGMRVIIPFGPRKITGFVIDITNQSEFKHLRNIIDVLDVQPVLTEELLQVGQWLAKETASLFITTFQAMLPQVLKSTYDKEIVRETEEQLTPELEKLFKEHDRVSYDEAVDMLSSLNELQQAIAAGNISINYLVKSNITKKYVQLIRPTERHVLLNEKENLRKNARIQHKIIDYFIEHPDEVNQNILCQRLAIKPYNLRPLIEKGVLTVNKKEVYRNP